MAFWNRKQTSELTRVANEDSLQALRLAIQKIIQTQIDRVTPKSQTVDKAGVDSDFVKKEKLRTLVANLDGCTNFKGMQKLLQESQQDKKLTAMRNFNLFRRHSHTADALNDSLSLMAAYKYTHGFVDGAKLPSQALLNGYARQEAWVTGKKTTRVQPRTMRAHSVESADSVGVPKGEPAAASRVIIVGEKKPVTHEQLRGMNFSCGANLAYWSDALAMYKQHSPLKRPAQAQASCSFYAVAHSPSPAVKAPVTLIAAGQAR